MSRSLCFASFLLAAACLVAPLQAQEAWEVINWPVATNTVTGEIQQMETPPALPTIFGGNNLWAIVQTNKAVEITGDNSFSGIDLPANMDNAFMLGVLEMPNVDLSSEFTQVITTQRGFQGNSRVITVPRGLVAEAFDVTVSQDPATGTETLIGNLRKLQELGGAEIPSSPDMMRSFFSGVSGLKIHQTKMHVIGNNIANVNTVGFRTNTVTIQGSITIAGGESVSVEIKVDDVSEEDTDKIQKAIENNGSIQIELIVPADGGSSRAVPQVYRAQCDPCAPVGCGSGLSRNLRFQGFGNYMNQRSTGSPLGGTMDGYTADTYGFLLALDRPVGRRGMVGAAFNGAFGKIESKDATARSDNDLYLFLLYGAARRDAWTLAGSLGYAYVDYDLRQREFLGFEASRTSYHGNLFTGAFDLSREFRFGKRSSLSPFLSLNYIHLRESGFTASQMRFNAKTTESYLQTLGVRWQTSCRLRNGCVIRPRATLGWVHDYGGGTLYTSGGYDFPGSDTYIIPGASRNKNRALVDLGVDLRLKRRWSVMASYGAELADDFTMQGFRIGAVRYW